MNQEYNNDNLIQNQVDNTINNIQENSVVYNQEVVAPIMQEVSTQMEVSQTEELKKSKIIVLDEDPVKFEVQEIQEENTDIQAQEQKEETKIEEPQVQTGNIQF
ncbi:MAG: hypothetical protein IJS56_04965 [Bacilli bacterium]|nr:hypothetical protein [Bacilli bacterium]